MSLEHTPLDRGARPAAPPLGLTTPTPPVEDARDRESLPPSEVVEKLIHAASLAPSPENNQPWHFEVHGDHLVLRYVPERGLSTDPKDVLNFVSLGAALENMKLQATVFGLAMAWRVESLTPAPRIHIRFEKTPIEVDPLVHFIARRHTNRQLFSSKDLSADEAQHLRQALASDRAIQSTLLESDAERQGIAKAFGVLDLVRFSYRIFHTEIFKSLSLSKREAQEKRQGLGAHRLALPPGGAGLLKVLSSWSVFQALNRLGLAKMFARMTAQQLTNSGAVVVISAPSMAVEDLLKAGQVMQRTWLAATEKGLAVQPLGHLAIFQNLLTPDGPLTKARDRQQVSQTLGGLRQGLGLAPDAMPVITLRVGRVKTPWQAENIRFPASELTTWPSSQPPESVRYHEAAFSRSLGLLTSAELELLRNKTVAIPGLGGVGGQHLMTLARLGVGGFHVADQDRFGISNVNRQYGATVSTFEQSKVEVMERLSRDINPHLRIKKWSTFIDATNVEAFLTGVDLVIDSIDAFNIEDRRIVFETARRMGIPVISAGPVGFSASMVIFTPQGQSFSDYIDYREGDSSEVKLFKFLVGMCPQFRHVLKYLTGGSVDRAAKVGPSVGTSTTLCAGFAGVEGLKLLLGRGQVKAAPHYHYYDAYLNRFEVGFSRLGNRHPWRRLLIKLVTRRLLAEQPDRRSAP